MISGGNARAVKVLRLAENYDNLISTILVGNNIVNITTTSLAGLFFAQLIVNNTSLAATVSTIVTTVAVLIFGEITPKMLAKVYPERFAMAGYALIKFFSYLLFPINIIFAGYKFILSKKKYAMNICKKLPAICTPDKIIISQTIYESDLPFNKAFMTS